METKVFGREAEMAEIEAMLGETRRGFAAIVLEGGPASARRPSGEPASNTRQGRDV
jgi:hypothetical protein